MTDLRPIGIERVGGRSKAGLLALVLLVLTVQPLLATDETASPELDRFKVGGLLFGDAYWVASYHQPESEGIVSAWIRRGYLTFDSELTRTWSGRVRFELNQAGEFDVFEFEADFKDLYLQKTIGEHRVLFGLSPTPTFNLIERIWGYRHIERTPLDLQGIASRDTGISANGPLNKIGTLTYRVMRGAQLEFGSDSNDAGMWMAAVSYEPRDSPWVLEVYFDFEDLQREGNDRATYQGFVAYQLEESRLALQYAKQDRGEEPGIELLSGFAVVDLRPTWSLIARFDRLFEPSLRGDNISYLPFSPDAEATLWILGIEKRLLDSFSLTPNVEFIRYDDPPGPEPRPNDDLLVRLTFFWTF